MIKPQQAPCAQVRYLPLAATAVQSALASGLLAHKESAVDYRLIAETQELFIIIIIAGDDGDVL